MRFLLVHFLVLSMVFGFPSVIAASSGDSTDWMWIWEKGEKKWRPQLEVTARPGNHSIYGMEIDPFLVLGQDGRSLAFLNVKNNLFWNEGDFSHELNAGGGYRHLMGDDSSWILGGYGFFDMMESRYDNTFYQGTLGVEALAWNWEARANGYIAGDDTKGAPQAGSGGVSLTGTTLKMGTVIEQAMSGFDAEVGWRLPFFGEDGILSDTRIYAGGFWFDASEVDSVGGPMTRFETRIWDVPFLMEGSRVVLGTEYRWDSQRNHQVTGLIALRVPIGRNTAPRPLTKVERRMTDRVVRDVSIVADTAVSGSERVRTRTGAIIEDVVYFANDAESDGTFDDPYDIYTAVDYAGGPSGTPENNLLIGLNRNGDINIGDPVELYDGQTVLGGGTSLWVWGANSGQMGVFKAPGGPATLCCAQGTFELANMNTIAGLNFRSQGTSLLLDVDSGSRNFDIYNNHFWNQGEGVRLEVSGEESVVHGYIWGNTFTEMGRALEVNASGSFDIDIDFYQNHMQDMGTGIQANLNPNIDDSFWTLNAYENFFKQLGENTGIDTDVTVSGGANYTHTSNIHHNEFVDNYGDDIEIGIFGKNPQGNVTVDVTIADNTSVGGYGFADVDVNGINYGQIDFSFLNNDVEHVHDADAIDVDMDGVPDVNVVASGNVIEKVHDGDGINVHIKNAGDDDGLGVNVEFLNNMIADVNDDGLYVNVEDSADTNVTTNDNVVKDFNSGNGIRIKLARTGNEFDDTNNITVSGNDIDDGNDNRGIAIETVDTYGPLSITVTDNTVDDIYNSEGIQVRVRENDDTVEIDVSRNAVDATGDIGIEIEVDDSGDTAVTVADNEVSNTGTYYENDDGDGIHVDLEEVGHDEGNTIDITGNTVDTVDDDGIRVRVRDGYDVEINVADNLIEHADDDGIEIDVSGNGHDIDDIINVTGNTINDTGDDGIEIDVYGDYYEGNFYGNYDTFVTVANNSITDAGNDNDDSGGDAIDVMLRGVGHSSGNSIDITGNTIEDADDNGIEVEVTAAYYDDDSYYGFDTDITISNNNITDTGDLSGPDGDFEDGEQGIGVLLRRVGHSSGNTVTIANNNVDDSKGEGIGVEVVQSYDTVVSINNNDVTNSDDDGIDVDVYYDGHTGDSHEVNVTNNNVTGADDDGIDVNVGYYDCEDCESGSDGIDITIANNNVSDVDDNGITVDLLDDTSDADVTITGNTVGDTGNNGVVVDMYEDAQDATVTITNNSISDVGNVPDTGDEAQQNGVLVTMDGGSEAHQVTITGNAISDAQRNGIEVVDGDNDENTVTVSSNNINQSDRYGIEMTSDDDLTINGSPSNNVVTNSGIADSNFNDPGNFTGTITVNGVAVPI